MSLTTLDVYFVSEYAATEVKGNLPECQVEGPLLGPANNGRVWMLRIHLPEGMSPMPQYPAPALLSKIERVIYAYDGLAVTPGGAR